jgi:hypothetical protein
LIYPSAFVVYVAGHATPFLVVHTDQQALLTERLVALLAPYPVVIAVVPPAVALLYGVDHTAMLFIALEPWFVLRPVSPCLRREFVMHFRRAHVIASNRNAINPPIAGIHNTSLSAPALFAPIHSDANKAVKNANKSPTKPAALITLLP